MNSELKSMIEQLRTPNTDSAREKELLGWFGTVEAVMNKIAAKRAETQDPEVQRQIDCKVEAFQVGLNVLKKWMNSQQKERAEQKASTIRSQLQRLESTVSDLLKAQRTRLRSRAQE